MVKTCTSAPVLHLKKMLMNLISSANDFGMVFDIFVLFSEFVITLKKINEIDSEGRQKSSEERPQKGCTPRNGSKN